MDYTYTFQKYNQKTILVTHTQTQHRPRHPRSHSSSADVRDNIIRRSGVD